MTAVVGENWRQLEAPHDVSLPRAVEHARNDHLVALVTLRETAVEAQVRRILRPVVTVEVCGSVEALAESVVSEEREVSAETLLYLKDSAFIQSRSCGGVLVVLDDQGINKTGEGISRAGRNPRPSNQRGRHEGRRVGRRAGVPVSIGCSLAVRQRQCRDWRLEEVRINSYGEPQCVRINATQRNRETWCYFALNAERSLLRIWWL